MEALAGPVTNEDQIPDFVAGNVVGIPPNVALSRPFIDSLPTLKVVTPKVNVLREGMSAPISLCASKSHTLVACGLAPKEISMRFGEEL